MGQNIGAYLVSIEALPVNNYIIFTGNVALCRSYIASSTTMKERTMGLSIIAAAMAIGFVIGPSKFMLFRYFLKTHCFCINYLTIMLQNDVSKLFLLNQFILSEHFVDVNWFTFEYNIIAKKMSERHSVKITLLFKNILVVKQLNFNNYYFKTRTTRWS